MKVEIDCYFEPDVAWLGEINRQTLLLERRVSVFPASVTQLECALWHGVDSKFGITLTLNIAGTKVISRAEDRLPVVATRRAFVDLNRKLTAFTEQTRNKDYWLRTSHNRGAKAESLRYGTPKTDREVVHWLDQYLSEIYNFVRREIATGQARGDLNAGDLTAEEILDEVASEALEEFAEKPEELGFRAWLFQLALETIKCMSREIDRDRRTIVSLSENGNGLKPSTGVGVEDEIYDFYQPEHEIELKDIVPDGRLPKREEALTQREIQRYINRALAQLPRRWREAFVLYSIEDFNLEEVARVTRESVDATCRSVEMAREYLRACLSEAGVKIAPEKRKEATAS
jgi:RNA polymerase sigma factor (sigma-70 family)